VTVFTTEGRPFQVTEGSFATLERRSLAKLDVERAETIDYAAEAPADVHVVNDSVGRFALWGYPRRPIASSCRREVAASMAKPHVKDFLTRFVKP